MSSGDIVEAVLRLITDRSRTSRDIQITLGKSREHISRTMKKMSDDGLVQRNTNAKPYSHSITQNGLSRLSGSGGTPQTIAHRPPNWVKSRQISLFEGFFDFVDLCLK